MSGRTQKKIALKIVVTAAVSLLCASSVFICLGSLFFPEVFTRHKFPHFFVFFLTFFISFQSILFIVLANKYVSQPLSLLVKKNDEEKRAGVFLHEGGPESSPDDEVTEVISADGNKLLSKTSAHPCADPTEKSTATRSELAEAFHDIALLYSVSQHFNSILGIDELIRTVRFVFTEQFFCHNFSFYLVLPRQQKLRLVAHHESLDDNLTAHQRLLVLEATCREVFQRRHNIYVSDLAETQETAFLSSTQIMKGSLFAIPLVVRGELIGVMAVHRKTAHAFSPTERQSLDSIASQISVAFDRARLYTKTKELAVKDELTGVYNRRHFQQMLNLEFKRAERFHRPVSLLMIDVDHFKLFNDTFGHLKGDEVLRLLAQLIKTNIREVDMMARFGGEEFVIVLPNTPFVDAAKVAEKLRGLVQSRLRIVMENASRIEETHSITMSVGVSAYPDCARTPKTLINTADLALYKAKHDGRNTVRSYEMSLLSIPEQPQKVLQNA